MNAPARIFNSDREAAEAAIRRALGPIPSYDRADFLADIAVAYTGSWTPQQDLLRAFVAVAQNILPNASAAEQRVYDAELLVEAAVAIRDEAISSRDASFPHLSNGGAA